MLSLKKVLGLIQVGIKAQMSIRNKISITVLFSCSDINNETEQYVGIHFKH